MSEKLGKCPHCSAVLTEDNIYISEFRKYVHVTHGGKRSPGYYKNHIIYTCQECKHVIGFSSWYGSSAQTENLYRP